MPQLDDMHPSGTPTGAGIIALKVPVSLNRSWFFPLQDLGWVNYPAGLGSPRFRVLPLAALGLTSATLKSVTVAYRRLSLRCSLLRYRLLRKIAAFAVLRIANRNSLLIR